mgnify:CR=1 FL=1
MKHILTSILTAALSCLSMAGETHDHGHSHAEIKVPATVPELRSGIATQQKVLAGALVARDAMAAHTATDLLVAYVGAIPGKLPATDEATLQRVTGMANNAAKAWGAAAHAAEDGDFEKAGREKARGDAAYGLLEARLPKD